VFVFLYILAAMGVAYWAKIDGRKPYVWVVLALMLTPLGASIALYLRERFGG
jgi:hypothetical protein